MQTFKRAAAIVLGTLLFSGGAMAAPESVENTVSRIMAQYGIAGTAANASIYPKGGGVSDEDADNGYIAWVRMSNGAPGYLVVETTKGGFVQQIYTRFGARIDGVRSF